MNTIESALWTHVDRSDPDGCWPWTAGKDSAGYGVLTRAVGLPKRRWRAHQVAYALCVGPVENGLTIDHLCRNRACANPAHLEPVTRGTNVARGGPFRRQTHCKRGHRLDTNRRSYGCLTCHNERSNARFHATYVPKGRQRSECRKGHPLSGDNLRVLPDGERQCITCARARSRAYWHRQVG